MRSLIVSNAITLDGFFAGSGGNPLVLNLDAGFDAHNLDLMRGAGTVLLGRKSFELFSSFWPLIADAPEDPSNPALSAVNREFSRLYGDVPKIMVSDGFVVPADNPWHGTTKVVGRAGLAATLAEEKASDGGDIVVFASATLWNGLLAEGAVDRLDLIMGPDAIGEGVPAFRAPARLRPLGATPIPGSSNVLLQYTPVRGE
ncbi:dihydrofolate reductase family protein [Microbacterium azadirachtae]|uniref:dihydrofolate reductase family protein n=1 Tax=Microbacterium azadirachtae TaxID=582680 RepID=UPI0021D49814|nr:dihydrofolate reductase family protein [Microbacterium azadirachtae]UXW86162.1 dihydrofolate reductase family protein [Microbacterium azadirachtae]